jgi:hypothetical protein
MSWWKGQLKHGAHLRPARWPILSHDFDKNNLKSEI